MASVRVRARKKYRRLQRRVPEGDSVAHLNITAMMDMMTILLIFFLKNFAVSSENIPLGEDMMLPHSASELKTHKSVEVTVTKRAILVEDRAIAAVSKGAVDSSIKQDGQSSFLITPLLDLLQKHATRLKKLQQLKRGKFEGDIVVIADQTTPYRLLSEILYTAGQAEFHKFRLVVLKGG